ncbi:MAG TPA: DMT family transporter [Quisquiliibacterium sp.]|nr:DMT family transporter [Quisquiliibacterium sp.]
MSARTVLDALRSTGVAAAIASALLFGASTPLAKRLLEQTGPWMLAGLLYLGSGLGLTIWRMATRAPAQRLAGGQWAWLAGALLSGGILAPVLLLYGLARMPASGAALLLNAESVFTALIAWIVFRENVDRRVALGMALIVGACVVLSWPGRPAVDAVLPALAVLGACALWGIDNNLTGRVSLADARWVAAAKGWTAGIVNLSIALTTGAPLPAPGTIALAAVLGWLSYGLSLTLFVVALRHLGAARTGAYFSLAPFAGAALALALGESATPTLALAALLMAMGVWLHLNERHRHRHTHAALEHSHPHRHDDLHHRHAHDPAIAPGKVHTHAHRHEAITHDHPHYPDEHHRHTH